MQCLINIFWSIDRNHSQINRAFIAEKCIHSNEYLLHAKNQMAEFRTKKIQLWTVTHCWILFQLQTQNFLKMNTENLMIKACGEDDEIMQALNKIKPLITEDSQIPHSTGKLYQYPSLKHYLSQHLTYFTCAVILKMFWLIVLYSKDWASTAHTCFNTFSWQRRVLKIWRHIQKYANHWKRLSINTAFQDQEESSSTPSKVTS